MSTRNCAFCRTPVPAADANCPSCGQPLTAGAAQGRRKTLRWLLLGGVLFVVLAAGAALYVQAHLPAWRRGWEAFRQASQLCNSVEAAERSTGVWPETLEDIFRRNEQGEYPPYHAELFLDPWGRHFLYEHPAGKDGQVRVWTYGRDGQPGGGGEDTDIEAVSSSR